MHRLVGWSGESYLYFLQNFGLKILKPSETSKYHFGGPNKPEIVRKLSIFHFPNWRDHRKTSFSAPKGAISAKSTKSEKGVRLCYTACMGLPCKIYHWLLVPKFFPDFPTCIGTTKKNWEKNPILIFSGWPCKLGLPFNWESQKGSKMRRIVKFRPRGTPYGKSGHETP